METKILDYIGIDDWNRPVFKVRGSNLHVGSVNILFDYSESPVTVINTFKDNIGLLCVFGYEFDCEPEGYPLSDKFKYIIETNIQNS